jgi:hypothetical protein
MSRVLLALLVLVTMPATAAATTQLIGGPAGKRPHLLTPDLHSVARGPKLPRRTFETVMSPDGDRFAALARRTITVYGRRTGRRLAGVPARGAIDLLWPARRHLVTFGYDRAAGGEVLRSIDLPSGHVRRQVPLDERLGAAASGNRIRVLLRSNAGLRVDEFTAGGKLRRSFRVPLPDGIDPGFSNASLRGDLVMVSYTTGAVAPYQHELVRLGGEVHPVDLAGTVYSFVTPTVLAEAGGHLARIDRTAVAVTREVDIDADQWVVPYRDGVVVGLGRAVYDGDLGLVASNPDARAAAAPPVVRGDRLYGRTVRCTSGGPIHGVVVVDATTAAVVQRRAGAFAIGALGGEISRPGEDGCD